MAAKEAIDIPGCTLIERMEKAKQDGGAFLTEGYVGEANGKTVRMYLDLGMDTYVDIPRDAVLYAARVKDDPNESTQMLISGKADLKLTHTMTTLMKAAQFDEAKRENQVQRATDELADKMRARMTGTRDDCQPAPCGCGGNTVRVAPASPSRRRGRDAVRDTARRALGPMGFVVDLF